MDRNSQNSQGYKLESQIREAYGKVTYSQTCHDKLINRLVKRDSRLKTGKIILLNIIFVVYSSKQDYPMRPRMPLFISCFNGIFR